MRGALEFLLAPSRIAIIAVLIAFGVITCVLTETYADADLWGHVRFGQDTLREGALARYDPYSYLSEGQPWINHEWLSEVVFGLLFERLGPGGLAALKLSISLFIMGIIYLWLLRRGLNAIASLVVLVLILVPLFLGLGTVRPHLFTYALFASTLYVIGSYEPSRPHRLWLLVPIFALWPNFHGGFLAGAAVLLMWFAVESTERFVRRRGMSMVGHRYVKELLAPTAAALLATLLNPYGPGLWAFLLRTATVARPEIVEWQSISITSLAGLFYLAVLIFTATSWLYSRLTRRPAFLAVYLAMALMPLVAVRHLPLFAIAAAMLSAEHMRDALQRQIAHHVSLPMGQVAGLAIASIAAVIGLRVPRLSRIDIPPDTFPVRAVQLIKENVRSHAHLAIDFNWGQYAIWHLGPAIQVSLDGRRETVYEEQSYQMSLNFHFGVQDWDKLLEQYETDLALVDKKKPIYNLLALAPGWELAYEDALCALFVSDESPVRAQILEAPTPDVPYDGGGRSFP